MKSNILCIDANTLYVLSMPQPMPVDELKFDRNGKLKEILNTPDDSDIGYFIEVDLNFQME